MDSQGDRKSGRTRRQKYLLKTVTVSSQPELARPMLQPCPPFNAHYHPFIAGPQCLSHFVFEWVSLCSFGHIHTHTQAHIVKGPCVSAFIAVGVAQAVGGRAGELMEIRCQMTMRQCCPAAKPHYEKCHK